MRICRRGGEPAYQGFRHPVPLLHLAAGVLQTMTELYVLVAPADEVRIVSGGSGEICRHHLHEPADRNHATLKLSGP